MEGSCHFLEGNIRAKQRVKEIKQLLDDIGIGGERLEMYNLSSSEGTKWRDFTTDMTERIKKLGPNPLNLIEEVSA